MANLGEKKIISFIKMYIYKKPGLTCRRKMKLVLFKSSCTKESFGTKSVRE